MSCGLNHTVCVSADGKQAWSFGDGDYGKLGIGNHSTKTLPARVQDLDDVDIRKVQCGTQFTAFLSTDGRVFTCGMDRLIGRTVTRGRGHTKPQQVCFYEAKCFTECLNTDLLVSIADSKPQPCDYCGHSSWIGACFSFRFEW